MKRQKQFDAILLYFFSDFNLFYYLSKQNKMFVHYSITEGFMPKYVFLRHLWLALSLYHLRPWISYLITGNLNWFSWWQDLSRQPWESYMVVLTALTNPHLIQDQINIKLSWKEKIVQFSINKIFHDRQTHSLPFTSVI